MGLTIVRWGNTGHRQLRQIIEKYGYFEEAQVSRYFKGESGRAKSMKQPHDKTFARARLRPSPSAALSREGFSRPYYTWDVFHRLKSLKTSTCLHPTCFSFSAKTDNYHGAASAPNPK